MSTIQVGGQLQPGTVDTPLDARSRVATLGDIANIPLPFVGMQFYVKATGKMYVVKSLKSKQIGPVVTENAAIDEYTEVGTGSGDGGQTDFTEFDNRYAQKDHDHEAGDVTGLQAALDGKAAADHDHEVGDVTGLQEALDGKAAADHDHEIGDVAGLQEALDGKAAADHDHAGAYAPLVEEKIPQQYFPEGVGARPSTIALPVPCDLDGENLTLVVDFSLTGEFVEGSEASYARVRMSDSYAKMRVFCNDSWEPVPGPSLGVPYYAGTVEFTLDQELFPGYVPGQKYYARYCWIDSSGNSGDWVGFAFRGDVADLVPIRTDDETPLRVVKEITKSGLIQLDYLDGEVQNFKLTGDASISLDYVSNVAFGEALIVNVKTDGHTLTVYNQPNSYTCSDDKTYVVVITNFGALNIAVTETV